MYIYIYTTANNDNNSNNTNTYEYVRIVYDSYIYILYQPKHFSIINRIFIYCIILKHVSVDKDSYIHIHLLYGIYRVVRIVCN